MQISHPSQWQADTLAGHSMVSLPAQMLLPAYYVVGDGEVAKQVLAGEGSITTQGVDRDMRFARLVGLQSLLAVQQPRHTFMRTLIAPAFTQTAVEALIPRMVSVISAYLETWAQSGQPVLAEPQLRSLTFDLICAVTFGREYSPAELQHMKDLFATWATGLVAWPPLQLPFLQYGKAMAAREGLMKCFQAAVDETRQQLASGSNVPGALANMMRAVDDEGNRLSDVELCDNLMLLLFAGHDTSSNTLINALALIQQHPEVKQMLQQEQAALQTKYGQQINGSALREMTYADAVIRETLRLRNVVPQIQRVAAADLELGGYHVPEGTALLLPLNHLNKHDPRWIADQPDAFRPERMLTAEGQKPGCQVSFGHGPRYCIGALMGVAEMKVFLALLTRGYEWWCDTDTEWEQQMGQVPKNGLPLTVTTRQ
eukprot:GHUV01035559.1.p1 GENE.GHUV01035559.1~~GHUV01035559.1.p1  ORF type:complete len:428 (+),score=123.78 GHUV01035559.1:560-1843(+)